MVSSREGKVGNYLVRMRPTKTGFGAVVLSGDKQLARLDGEDPDRLWQETLSEAARLNPSFVGYDGAIKKVLDFFPEGFRDPGYATHERTYKLAAKKALDRDAPVAAVVTDPATHVEPLVAAYRATNLLSPYEKTWIVEGLRGPNGAVIAKAAADFGNEPTTESLRAFETALRPHNAAKWTVVTYLPYLWRPDRHTFLKPEVTKIFAERVGHAFADRYDAALRIEIYEGLLELVAEVRSEISSLHPADNIDIQSFIWIAGAYDKELDPQR